MSEDPAMSIRKLVLGGVRIVIRCILGNGNRCSKKYVYYRIHDMSVFMRILESGIRVAGTCHMRVLSHLTFRRCSGTDILADYAREARAYLPPLASNTLLVPSRLAFLQRSASGTVLPAA